MTYHLIADTYELATGRQTAQSSTFKNSQSWRAVDGVKTHKYNEYTNPCSGTNLEPQAWWMVTFDREAVVHSVTVSSRACCFQWTKDFSIKVGNVKDHRAIGFCKENIGIHKTGTWLFKCDKLISGRYLYTVNNVDNASMLFCEVEVSGSYI